MAIWFNGRRFDRVDEVFFVAASDVGTPAPVSPPFPVITEDDRAWLADSGIAFDA